MNEQEFRSRAIANGFSDFQQKEYPFDTNPPLHSHEFSVTLIVTRGEFCLQFPNTTSMYSIGDYCDLPANTIHAERAGENGASVLLARKV